MYVTLIYIDGEKTTLDRLPFPDMLRYRTSPWFSTIPKDFSDPNYLRINTEGYIHIAVLLKNITAANECGFKLRVKFSKWLNSLVTNTNR